MPKKSMTIVDVKAWIAETRSMLQGSRIVNVYHIDNIVILKLWTKGKEGKQNLLIEPGKRIH